MLPGVLPASTLGGSARLWYVQTAPLRNLVEQDNRAR